MLQLQGLRLPPKIRHDNGLTVKRMGRKEQQLVAPPSIFQYQPFTFYGYLLYKFILKG
jgi:hypothetical protein